MQDYLQKLQRGEGIGSVELQVICDNILDSRYSELQVAAFLYGLSLKGETENELYSFAKILRSKAKVLTVPDGSIDICGTGGDGLNYLNVSTATSFVVASGGVSVAKHGNKAVSSRSGSSDVFQELGINVFHEPEKSSLILKKVGLVFLLAPLYHPAMKAVATIRQELKVRTIFNVLGPILNPGLVKRQLVGVFDEKYLLTMAKTLERLGSEKALIVHGSDGADEITNVGKTKVVELNCGKIVEYTLSPEDFGLKTSLQEDLIGGDVVYNARRLTDMLSGEESAYKDIVIANSAAAFYVAGKVDDFRSGADLARHLISSKKAESKLKELIMVSKNV